MSTITITAPSTENPRGLAPGSYGFAAAVFASNSGGLSAPGLASSDLSASAASAAFDLDRSLFRSSLALIASPVSCFARSSPACDSTRFASCVDNSASISLGRSHQRQWCCQRPDRCFGNSRHFVFVRVPDFVIHLAVPRQAVGNDVDPDHSFCRTHQRRRVRALPSGRQIETRASMARSASRDLRLS